MSQLAIPVRVEPAQVVIKKTLGKAIELCIELGGFDLDKQVSKELGFDKTQLSRWQSGQEGIHWQKLEKLMDACGNDAPLLWMLHARGYDLGSVRQRETEIEHENRMLREEVAALRRVVRAAA